MDTPENTLLAVLQVISWILTLLMAVAARQERHRNGVWLWVAVFAIQALSQTLREVVEATWGHQVGLPIGHVGGPLAYAVLYIGVRRYLGLLPQSVFAVGAVVVAALMSIATIAQGMNYTSLALTACITALFQALTANVFWNTWRSERGLVRIGAAAIFAISTATSLTRAVAVVPTWHVQPGLLPSNTFWLLAYIALIVLQAGSLLFLINQTLLDELQNMADFDSLTGLLNRRGLSRRMKRRRVPSGTTGSMRMGMLCMDLDHFKAINDLHGHGVGDDVLRGIGQMLRENSRAHDTAVRQGGEEFGMIVEAGSAEELRVLAERHRAAVERDPFPTRVGPIPVTISIGAALSASPAESLDEISERADQSLLAAKRSGRNRVVMSPEATQRP